MLAQTRRAIKDASLKNHKHQCRTGQWIYTTDSGECEVLEIELPLRDWEKPGYVHRTRSPQLNKMLRRKKRKAKAGKA